MKWPASRRQLRGEIELLEGSNRALKDSRDSLADRNRALRRTLQQVADTARNALYPGGGGGGRVYLDVTPNFVGVKPTVRSALEPERGG